MMLVLGHRILLVAKMLMFLVYHQRVCLLSSFLLFRYSWLKLTLMGLVPALFPLLSPAWLAPVLSLTPVSHAKKSVAKSERFSPKSVAWPPPKRRGYPLRSTWSGATSMTLRRADEKEGAGGAEEAIRFGGE